jgi:hypothetical protein
MWGAHNLFHLALIRVINPKAHNENEGFKVCVF